MIMGSQVESNISTTLFTNMLNNVGLRLQPCRTPKGVNVAISPLFAFTVAYENIRFSSLFAAVDVSEI